MHPSELILNQDGSVYHLGLCREDVAKDIILTGDPGRVSLISSMFDSVEIRKERREFITHTGWIGKKRVTAMSTGMGTDNIDIVMNELDILVNFENKYRVKHNERTVLNLIRLGTSGGVNRTVNVGEIVLSASAIGLDNLIKYYSENDIFVDVQLNEFFRKNFPLIPDPYIARADDVLIQSFHEIARKGITITAPGFYGPQGRNVVLNSKYPDMFETLEKYSHNGLVILNMEMESSAMYALSHLMGHRALTVCVVLANRITGEYATEPARHTRHMLEKCLAILAGS